MYLARRGIWAACWGFYACVAVTSVYTGLVRHDVYVMLVHVLVLCVCSCLFVVSTRVCTLLVHPNYELWASAVV